MVYSPQTYLHDDHFMFYVQKIRIPLIWCENKKWSLEITDSIRLSLRSIKTVRISIFFIISRAPRVTFKTQHNFNGVYFSLLSDLT